MDDTDEEKDLERQMIIERDRLKNINGTVSQFEQIRRDALVEIEKQKEEKLHSQKKLEVYEKQLRDLITKKDQEELKKLEDLLETSLIDEKNDVEEVKTLFKRISRRKNLIKQLKNDILKKKSQLDDTSTDEIVKNISISSNPHYTPKTPSKRKAESISPKKEIEYHTIYSEDGYLNSPSALDTIPVEDDNEQKDISIPKSKILKLEKEDETLSMPAKHSPAAISKVSTLHMSGKQPWMDEVWEWYSRETRKRVLLRSDVHNKGVSLNIGMEMSKSWVKNWCRKYKVNLMDQPVFQDIAIIEQKAIDWLLERDRPTLGRDDRIRIENILRKEAAELGISDEFITKKYLERLIKRKRVSKPKAFLQKKFGTMTLEDEEELSF